MSKITEKLASLHYTAWNLVILLLWLVWGMLMAASDSYTKGFQGMNNVILREWLETQSAGSVILKFWFLGLCVLMTFLGINLIFCSWEKIFRIIRIKFNGSKFFMLIVHAIFGLVAICHFGGLMLGYEYNNVKLGEGKKYSFDNGYEIEIKSVQYINDYKILINAPKYLTKDQFDYKKNFADIVLSKNGKEVCRADVYQLIPLSFNDIQVTLKGFIASPESGEKIASKNLKPWVNVSVSRNPVLKFFLALYPLMIIGISIYLIMTWKTSIKNKFENSKLES